MQGNQVGFESSFQQHLDSEQRRAVLEAIGTNINPDSTLGEILDAAEALGWSEKMGDLSLADLAEALLAPEGDEPAALGAEDEEDEEDEDEDLDEEDEDLEDEDEDLEDEDEDEDDEFELVVQEPVAPRRKTKKASAKKKAAKKAPYSKKKAAKKAPYSKKKAKKAPYSKNASSKKTASKKAAKKAPSSKKTAKKAPSAKKASRGRRKLTAVDVDERMSLDQAAEFFLPYVEDLGEATMQALEEQTGVSRRKLRFHVGQLVKHGYLERHGMGRGTFYTRT